METEKKFKTKTGFCHIFSDKIILTRDGIIGDIANLTSGNGIARILIIYCLLSIFLFYQAYNSFLNGHVFISIFLGIIGIYFVYNVLISLNNSATPVIERKNIKTIKFINGTNGITRSRFEVYFQNNGKIKKRLILLPGSLSNGNSETQKAVQLMKEEGLIS